MPLMPCNHRKFKFPGWKTSECADCRHIAGKHCLKLAVIEPSRRVNASRRLRAGYILRVRWKPKGGNAGAKRTGRRPPPGSFKGEVTFERKPGDVVVRPCRPGGRARGRRQRGPPSTRANQKKPHGSSANMRPGHRFAARIRSDAAP